MNAQKEEVAEYTNPDKIEGKLADVIKDADFFVGVSVAGALSQENVKLMKKDPVIMALANPVPEIMPELAFEAGAKIVCTGRSDYPNQVNNSLAFPGIFRSIFENRITDVNIEMKLAAARAIAKKIDDDKLTPNKIIPHALDTDVPRIVSEVMKETAFKLKLIRPAPKSTEWTGLKGNLYLEEANDI